MKLTPRETQIRELTKAGKTANEIGAALGISPHTVKVHRRNLAVKLAIARGELIDPTPHPGIACE